MYIYTYICVWISIYVDISAHFSPYPKVLQRAKFQAQEQLVRLQQEHLRQRRHSHGAIIKIPLLSGDSRPYIGVIYDYSGYFGY